MYTRPQLSTLVQRIEKEQRRFIQVLAGPRQVGKTTLVTQFSQQTSLSVHFISADGIIEDGRTWIQQQWELARLKARGNEAVLIIDEIQKIHNWSEQVKKEWDADTRNGLSLKVILLGSSRLLLQKGLTESLAGRFEMTYLGHWSYAEMKKAFQWSPEEYVWFGGYPGAAPLITDPARWRSYVTDSLIETSVSKDILMLTRVDKPALIRRLFELGSRYSGQILSYTKMIGQLQDAGNTTTVAHYLNLLHSAGLLSGLEKYSPNIIRQRASSPKFQVQNNAFLTVSQASELQEILGQPKLWGRWVESAVGAHLLNMAIAKGHTLSYWRDRDQEVDFVYEGRGKVLVIEVKSSFGKPSAGFQKFMNQNPGAIPLLIGKEGIDWQEFLEQDIDEYLR